MTLYKHQKWEIPTHMMPALAGYVAEGKPVGDFLRAVICNDLFGAIGHADGKNINNLPAYAMYFYNETPSECFGSPEKYDAWVKKHADARKEQDG